MRIRALALVGSGVLVAFAVAAQEISDRPASSWPAPPYWLPAGVMPAAGSEAAEAAPEAAEPVIVRALPLVAIPPCRLLDTRGEGLAALAAGVGQEIAVVGRCGIPAQAQGVSVRLVVAERSGGGQVIVGPAAENGGGAGRLVLDPGATGVTTGVVGLDESGRLLAAVETGSIHLVIEVNGYYAAEPAVRSLNALAGDVTLEAGENVEITSDGNVVTIAVAKGGGREGERPGESEPPVPGTLEPVRHLVQAPASPQARALPPVKAMAPPSSSVYFGGALGMPNTTALGAGVITLGGVRFLHNYGPDNAHNTFVGESAGNFTMGATGFGRYNTGLGHHALVENTSGSQNTASGFYSLTSNTTGISNTASGCLSLLNNTTGNGNTASGYQSLESNTTGSWNTASGYNCLFSNSRGNENTASGFDSLYSNTSGDYNTASGARSLRFNTTGSNNTASGAEAGDYNSTGYNNTFLGALSDAAANNLTNATAVGYNARVDASNHVRIGNTFVTQIGGQVAWSNLSDARLKEAIRDLDLGLDFVLGLRPVSFQMKGGNARTDMGFLAQDIEALIGDGYNLLGIGQDAERTLSLRATDLIAPLVKAVQEQQVLIDAQQSRLDRLEQELQALRAALIEPRRDVPAAR